MHRTLGDHLAQLDQKIRTLKDQLIHFTGNPAEQQRIDAELRVAELALLHYQMALRLENDLT